jgi:hypothetical protein
MSSADGRLAELAALPEASGLAATSRLADLLWSHNDFRGDPALFALNTRGAVTARLWVIGATATDWEAIAVGPGPCPARSCLYIGDIGDNAAVRERITVYRVAEPAPGEMTVPVQDVFHGTYPDTAHDAEALLVTHRQRLCSRRECPPLRHDALIFSTRQFTSSS